MMRKRMMYIASVAVLVAIGAVVFPQTTLAGYESAEYKVVESDANFEVREYPDLMMVATTTKIDAQGRDGSFMKLLSYISGANESDQKISITTPVFMENDKADSAVQMGFVMPKEVAVEAGPSPTGPDVDVRRRTFRGPPILRTAAHQARQRIRRQAPSLKGTEEPRRGRFPRIERCRIRFLRSTFHSRPIAPERSSDPVEVAHEHPTLSCELHGRGLLRWRVPIVPACV